MNNSKEIEALRVRLGEMGGRINCHDGTFCAEDLLENAVILNRYLEIKNQKPKIKPGEEILTKCKEMQQWVEQWRDFDSVSWYQQGLDELEVIIENIAELS